jgi:dimethylargininase
MLTAVTRTPSRDLAECELTHVRREPIDLARALDEHAAYRSALSELGVSVVNLPPLDDLPDATFIEDAAVVVGGLAVITRPGAELRRRECEPLAEVLSSVLALARLPAPGTLDGGDVLAIGDVLYVGQSTRTDHAGLKALAHLVLEHGYRVKAVSVRGALHLKTACTYLGRDTLLANPAWADMARFAGFQFIEVDPAEPFAANALRVHDALVMSSAFPRTLRRVESAGFDVRPVDISQFALAEAGVTCLSLVFDSPRPL